MSGRNSHTARPSEAEAAAQLFHGVRLHTILTGSRPISIIWLIIIIIFIIACPTRPLLLMDGLSGHSLLMPSRQVGRYRFGGLLKQIRRRRRGIEQEDQPPRAQRNAIGDVAIMKWMVSASHCTVLTKCVMPFNYQCRSPSNHLPSGTE